MARLVEHFIENLRLLGYSVAGEETVIAAPELNVCFDVGNAPAEMLAIDHVLLSHGHMDHAAGLAYYFSQRNFVGNAPGCVLAPHPLVQPIRDLLKVWARIEGHESPARIIGMAAGDKFDIRRGLVARAFDVNHRVASLGYSVVAVRHKLRPEFAAKTGPELVALKKQGIQIEQIIEVPLVTFCGDTAEGPWIDQEVVTKAKVVILECSFFEADHIHRARDGYHLHVRDVARIIHRLDGPHFVLHHVSRRTGLRDAKDTLLKLIGPDQMARVTFLMDRRKAAEALSEISSRSVGKPT
ncbi:MAG TPA: MBL fold metallo-hydrolase [Phycisphaerae bacterium]|nr:MBL fold metallo-hydrolase [Phycisphaerae bacterium]